MSGDEEEGCTLALSWRRTALLALLLEYHTSVAEALETAATAPDSVLRNFTAYRWPRVDRPGRARRGAGFKAGRR
jgi:hypothetical protein